MLNPNLFSQRVKSHIAKRLSAVSQLAIAMDIWGRTHEFRDMEDIVAQRLILQLERYCAALGEEEVRWPKDWWQALRARFAPRWWLKRHPVLWETRRIYAAICPHGQISFQGPHLEWLSARPVEGARTFNSTAEGSTPSARS